MIGCGVLDGQAREFSTVEVAEILGVNRMNFYEWTCRKYIQPVRESKRRGNAAVFDMAGLVAGGIFSRLHKNIRRPIAGKICIWYQSHGHLLEGDTIKCAIHGDDVRFLNGEEPGEHDYIITIPIGSIRKWIENRIVEMSAEWQKGQAQETSSGLE